MLKHNLDPNHIFTKRTRYLDNDNETRQRRRHIFVWPQSRPPPDQFSLTTIMGSTIHPEHSIPTPRPLKSGIVDRPLQRKPRFPKPHHDLDLPATTTTATTRPSDLASTSTCPAFNFATLRSNTSVSSRPGQPGKVARLIELDHMPTLAQQSSATSDVSGSSRHVTSHLVSFPRKRHRRTTTTTSPASSKGPSTLF